MIDQDAQARYDATHLALHSRGECKQSRESESSARLEEETFIGAFLNTADLRTRYWPRSRHLMSHFRSQGVTRVVFSGASPSSCPSPPTEISARRTHARANRACKSWKLRDRGRSLDRPILGIGESVRRNIVARRGSREVTAIRAISLRPPSGASENGRGNVERAVLPFPVFGDYPRYTRARVCGVITVRSIIR